jgi:signal transduction histidine kinase
VAGVAVAGVVTVVLVLFGQAREIDSQLAALVAAPHTTAAPAGTFVATVDGSGRRSASPGAPDELPRGDQQRVVRELGHQVKEETYVDDREYQTLTKVVGNSVIQAGVALGPYESERHRLMAALALAGLGAALVAALLGQRLGRRAVGVWDDALGRQRAFIADASHELRTPLARLALRADLLRDAIRADSPREALLTDATMLRDESTGLADIVEDLLLAADFDTAADVGELVDVEDVVREVLQHNMILASQRGVRLSGDLSAVPPVRGAVTALRRAVDALVDNALRHARSAVVVGLAEREATVVVTVDDDGTGLARGEADRIFTRFARGAGSERGFGLGLALVREVVQRHGGSVHAEALDVGTRFVLLLPSEPPEAT